MSLMTSMCGQSCTPPNSFPSFSFLSLYFSLNTLGLSSKMTKLSVPFLKPRLFCELIDQFGMACVLLTLLDPTSFSSVFINLTSLFFVPFHSMLCLTNKQAKDRWGRTPDPNWDIIGYEGKFVEYDLFGHIHSSAQLN